MKIFYHKKKPTTPNYFIFVIGEENLDLKIIILTKFDIKLLKIIDKGQ